MQQNGSLVNGQCCQNAGLGRVKSLQFGPGGSARCYRESLLHPGRGQRIVAHQVVLPGANSPTIMKG